MIVAIDKVDGHGHCNTVCQAHLAKKIKLMLYFPCTEGRHINYLAAAQRWNTSVLKVSVDERLATHLGFTYTVIIST